MPLSYVVLGGALLLAQDPFTHHPVHRHPKPLAFSGEHLGQCMALVAQHQKHSNLRVDQYEAKCTWVVNGKRFLYKGEDRPSLDLYLMGGQRNCDYTSGHEEALHAWILEQPLGSVSPLQMFEKSLALSSGNLWTAILAPFQLLRKGARWVYKHESRYNTLGSEDMRNALFDRLKDIRGSTPGADHPGSWYRIWGAMLYRLSWDEKSSINQSFAPEGTCVGSPPGMVEQMRDHAKDLGSAMVFALDEWVLKFFKEKDPDKMSVDMAGLWAVKNLVRSLQDTREMDVTLEECRRHAYLSPMAQ